jgi:hypothetical protein
LTDKSEEAHVKNKADFLEIRSPGGDRLRFSVLRAVKGSGKNGPFALLNNVALDLGGRPAIENVMSGLSSACVTGSTHIVNRSIALRTD